MKEYRVLNEIHIQGSHLTHNYHYFKTKNPNIVIAPVLKSNAYGHGLAEVGTYITQNLTEVPFVCVDSLYEAYELTKSGFVLPILIMGYTNPENYKIHKKLPYIFTVYDIDSMATLARYQPHARVHIKIDTGMCRLGIMPKDVSSFIRAAEQYRPSLRVEGIYSHLSQADEPNRKSFTKKQVLIFKTVLDAFHQAGYTFTWQHIAATAGAEIMQDPIFNLTRLGLGFYGYSPFGPHTKEGRRQRAHLQPALELVSHIALTKQIEPGDQIGYGGTYKAKQNEQIAVLPLGYNEGLSRKLSNRGVAMIGETPCPIIGRISMNMTTIKLVRTLQPKVGNPVLVISSKPSDPNSIYQLASFCDTIPYEILTSLHPSIRRRLV